jgi:DNA-binding PadR family transcriptional regulator
MPSTSTDLDLFILALIQCDCATPYDLKAKGGISIGSSAPVLERLAKDGFLKKSKPGVRDKVQFSITKSGKKELESRWQSVLATHPTDPDAILRMTYLAWALGRLDVMKKFIEEAARSLRNAAATRRAEANQTQGPASDVGAGAFRWLKARFEAARLEAQSKELLEMGDLIRKNKKK